MEPDKNDAALTQYFVRGMHRFAKHVPETPPETVIVRIEAAYCLALSLYQIAKKEDKECLENC
jgi:hypothetical protein